MNKWYIDETGKVFDFDSGALMVIVPSDTSDEVKKMIEKTPEMYGAILDFLSSVEIGKLKAKRTYNKFKSIVDAIPQL